MMAIQLNGTHKAAIGWSLGILSSLLMILSLLGLLPWATRAELVEFKAVHSREIKDTKEDVNRKFDQIDKKLDVLISPGKR